MEVTPSEAKIRENRSRWSNYLYRRLDRIVVRKIDGIQTTNKKIGTTMNEVKIYKSRDRIHIADTVNWDITLP